MADGLILVFDDDDGTVEYYTDMLSAYGYRTRHYSKPTDFLAQGDTIARLLHESSAVITDGDMPMMHGLEFARRLRTEHNYSKSIIYNTGNLDPACLPTNIKVTRADGSDILLANYALEKPVSMKLLISTVEAAVKPKP